MSGLPPPPGLLPPGLPPPSGDSSLQIPRGYPDPPISPFPPYAVAPLTLSSAVAPLNAAPFPPRHPPLNAVAPPFPPRHPPLNAGAVPFPPLYPCPPTGQRQRTVIRNLVASAFSA